MIDRINRVIAMVTFEPVIFLYYLYLAHISLVLNFGQDLAMQTLLSHPAVFVFWLFLSSFVQNLQIRKFLIFVIIVTFLCRVASFPMLCSSQTSTGPFSQILFRLRILIMNMFVSKCNLGYRKIPNISPPNISPLEYKPPYSLTQSSFRI